MEDLQWKISEGRRIGLVSLYKGSAGDTLDKLRLERFQQKVATSVSCVRPENLPPTSSAAKFHSLHVYHQVQVWKGVTTLDLRYSDGK
ncbi:hypothetical protein HOLleu_21287 [Holothuria leucospilota]|uniref:Uncharacterized protein n=1 Tax=Holothuria leucospilota TaxID=206669 RepID=A0A9Q1BW74_HOLLE|nr:hypothetical protein HOLleu_21287 [Holothuria leucospilota]